MEEAIRRLSNTDLRSSTYKLIMELNNESQSEAVANPRKLKTHLNSQLNLFNSSREEYQPSEVLVPINVVPVSNHFLLEGRGK